MQPPHPTPHPSPRKNKQQTPLEEGKSGIGNEHEDTSQLGRLGYYQVLPGSQAAGGEGEKVEMKKSSDSACILTGSSLFPLRTTENGKSGNIHLTNGGLLSSHAGRNPQLTIMGSVWPCTLNYTACATINSPSFSKQTCSLAYCCRSCETKQLLHHLCAPRQCYRCSWGRVDLCLLRAFVCVCVCAR